MTDKQPEALRLADTLDLAPENGIEPQTSEDAAAELRRLHTENTALQQGYAAARLEIESLRAALATPQPSPASQGDALSDAVRVPLDSLHADAACLIGRLREGSMPYARVIEIIRERIDAAKAAIRARAAAGHVTQERVDQAMALPGAPAQPVAAPLTDEAARKQGGV